MAHPSAAFPKSFSYVTGSAAPQNGGYFTSVLCTVAGTVTLSGGVGSDAIYDDDAAVDTIDISMTAGMIIYGRFTAVTSDGTGEFVAYLT